MRRLIITLSTAGLLLSLALWLTSYFGVSYTRGSLTCRALWGNLIFYPDTVSSHDGWRMTGFQDLTTFWYRFPHGNATSIPLWMPTAGFLILLFVPLGAHLLHKALSKLWGRPRTRKAMRGLTALSVVGLFLSTALWVLSYFDLGYVHSPQRSIVLQGIALSDGGLVYFDARRNTNPQSIRSGTWRRGSKLEVRTLGSWAYGTRWLGNYRWSNVIKLQIPLWLPTVLFALAIVLLYFFPNRNEWRRMRGLCTHCGYDLSGLSGQRCPECGAVPALFPGRRPAAK